MSKTYPCDLDGGCPFNASTGMDCRDCCGAGTDDGYNPDFDEYKEPSDAALPRLELLIYEF